MSRHPLITHLSCIALAITLQALAQGTQAQPGDARLLYRPDGPEWLRAIGKLRVPGIRFEEGRRRHHVEDCSATLVAPEGATQADTIVTAWHCLEYYGDLSHRITFTLLPGSAQSFTSEALQLQDGGGMHADWAILRLRRAVPSALVRALPPRSVPADPARGIAMAGYSRDLGENGARLSYDPDCEVVQQQRRRSESNCAAAKGASGGAVVQLRGDGGAELTGVISEGDGQRRSFFVPVAGFTSALQRHAD